MNSVQTSADTSSVACSIPTTFDVESVSRIDRRPAAWIDVICEYYYPLDLRFDAQDVTIGKLVIADVDKLRVGTLDCEPMSIERNAAHIKRDKLEHFMIPLSAGPRLHISQRGSQGSLSRGDLGFVATSESYSYGQLSRGRTTALRLPANLVRERLAGADDLCGIRFDGTNGMVAIFVDFALSCIRHGQSLEEEKVGVMRCFLDLFALAISAPRAACLSDETSVKLAHRRRALRFIDANFQRFDLHSGTVSAATGISPRYLQKIFAEKGQRVSTVIAERRIAEAKRLLAARQNCLNISQIAFCVGYADVSYFCRSFKSSVGMTPRDYRDGLRDG